MIGGTGTISSAISKKLALSGHELYLLNRGKSSHDLPENVNFIHADIHDEALVSQKIIGMQFDAVCEFIGFLPSDAERDYRLFNGKTKQYIFISSASAYNNRLRTALSRRERLLQILIGNIQEIKLPARNFS